MDDSENSLFYNELIIPPELLKWYTLEEDVFNINDQNIEDILKLFESYIQDSKGLLYNLILQVSSVRRFSYKSLAILFSKIDDDKYFQNAQQNTPFLDYLCLKGFLSPKSLLNTVNTSKSMEEYENIFTSDTTFYAISKDDVETISFRSSEPKFYHQTVVFDECPDGISLLSFAAYCGSLKVFKFLIINGSRIEKETLQNAIKGGSEEILEILAQEYSFNYFLTPAVQYHRNNIASWLTENFKCEDVDLNICINSFNTLSLIYQITKMGYIEPNDDTVNTPLLNAISQMNIDIVSYLISQGADIECHDPINKWSPLIVASQIGNLPIVKCLHENGADIESSSVVAFTPLFVAAKNGNLDVVKYLVENGANIEGKEESNWTPLLIATFHERTEVCDYLRSKGANTAAQAKTPRFIRATREVSHRNRRRPR